MNALQSRADFVPPEDTLCARHVMADRSSWEKKTGGVQDDHLNRPISIATTWGPSPDPYTCALLNIYHKELSQYMYKYIVDTYEAVQN